MWRYRLVANKTLGGVELMDESMKLWSSRSPGEARFGVDPVGLLGCDAWAVGVAAVGEHAPLLPRGDAATRSARARGGRGRRSRATGSCCHGPGR